MGRANFRARLEEVEADEGTLVVTHGEEELGVLHGYGHQVR
jgi:hypothetical protein